MEEESIGRYVTFEAPLANSPKNGVVLVSVGTIVARYALNSFIIIGRAKIKHQTTYVYKNDNKYMYVPDTNAVLFSGVHKLVSFNSTLDWFVQNV